MNKVLIDNINFLFDIVVISIRNSNAKNKYKEKIIKLKEQEEVVNVDDHKENVSEEIILQDEEHSDNIDLDEVDYHRWWKWWKFDSYVIYYHFWI